jgi:hypothetical protein
MGLRVMGVIRNRMALPRVVGHRVALAWDVTVRPRHRPVRWSWATRIPGVGGHRDLRPDSTKITLWLASAALDGPDESWHELAISAG